MNGLARWIVVDRMRAKLQLTCILDLLRVIAIDSQCSGLRETTLGIALLKGNGISRLAVVLSGQKEIWSTSISKRK